MERGILRLFWRRQWILYLCLLFTASAAFLYYAMAGERYEAYTLLRSGQGIKERSGNAALGEGIDLQSRMESLARLAKIDTVIQQAAKEVGYDRLSSDPNPTLMAQFLAWAKEVRHAEAYEPTNAETQADADRKESAILGLRDRVVAKQEGRSDLLRISFRHADPSIAASFLNELANSLVAVNNAEVQLPGAQEFFQQQTKRLEQDAETAAANLESFSVRASIYSVDEQRQLLLKRATDLAALMSTTRGAIEEKKGQKQAIVTQLEHLKPVAQSKTVSQMVRIIGGLGRPGEKQPEQFEEAPPLLLIKVYQDNMAQLMKVNAELVGTTDLLNQLGTELENVNKELALLSSKEAEYGRLKRFLTTASTAAAHYASRMVEEEISSEVAKKSQLSSLRVMQKAISPTAPVFPQIPHLIALAMAGGLLLGCALIVGPELARASLHPHRDRAPGVRDDDPVDLLAARQRKEGSKDVYFG
ncbi:MAG: hypothetical protein HY852_24820 [Bradyrhizobium sp.]|uniref:GumC family protein n=1 Tax=Bradyrhizobium sp. TaxID=376 RepID=UPI0025C1CA51|nr:hypothetical protein [Bradyrhizobium sp.]MBI5265030.1 hypothetical protein [Bradyrhizobium sp.]